VPATVTNVDELAARLRVGIGLLVRRLRQFPEPDELTLSETSALARLDRGGPTTAAALAKAEQISPQSMGTIVASLVDQGLVARQPDPADRRRSVLTPTEAGLAVLRGRRTIRTARLSRALVDEFSPSELEHLATAAPLIERLAQHV
jgi:DNA-binding MarR family transcriptional regulator